jgi:GLPGLI family protein
MIKSLVSVIVLFATLSISAQPKQIETKYIAQYAVTWQPIKTEKDVFKNIEYVLALGGTHSLYMEKNAFIMDTTVVNAVHRGENGLGVIPKLSGLQVINQEAILKDSEKSTVLVKSKLSALDMHYVDDLRGFNWKLDPQTDEISGYACKRATLDFGGRSYVAWYTTEIPISDGPYKFKGLPGLIVKIEDSAGEYKFLLRGLKKTDVKINLQSFLDSDLKSKKDYYKLLSNFYENPVMFQEAQGAVFTPEVRKLVNEKLKARYKYVGKNPIELTLE